MKNYNNFINERKIAYKKQLCPDIWKDNNIIQRIEDKLLRIARDFYKELELEVEISDIILTGSIVNYSYNTYSDIDVHIVIDFSEVNDDVTLVKKALDGQRFIWNMKHDIVIAEHDVEIYVQDISEEHIAAGKYSLMNHTWIKIPEFNPPDVDTKDINVKYQARAFDIDELEKLSKTNLDSTEAEDYHNKSKDLMKKIMKSRKEGLSDSGEFSIENLVFKKLRNEGKIEKLINTINNLYDMIYSQ